MHPFSVLTLGIFVAGYITARFDLVIRLHELAIFAWDHGVVTRTVKGLGVLSACFAVFISPFILLAIKETESRPRAAEGGLSAREQLRRRGSF